MATATAIRLLARDGDGNVLLGRRASSDRFAGHWEVFGGAADVLADGTREDDRTALARELDEEAGLALVGPITKVDERTIVTPRGRTITQITYAGTATGTIRLSDEHDAAGWHAHLPSPLTDSTAAILANLGITR